MSFPNRELMHEWIEPLGLCVMLVVALMLGLALVRYHGRTQERLARTERRHPFAAPTRTLLSFAVAFACVLAFVPLAREVAEGKTVGFDKRVALAVHSLDGRVLDHVMQAFTFIGSPIVVVPVALFVFGFAYRRADYRAAFVLVLVAASSEVLNQLLKDTFERMRPMLFEKTVIASYSFPSGHAMGAVAVYGMLGVILTRLLPARRGVFEIGFPILIAMIGLSRIYLGVHWPTDVLAGFAAGGFLVIAGAITLDGVGSTPPSASISQSATVPLSSRA